MLVKRMGAWKKILTALCEFCQSLRFATSHKNIIHYFHTSPNFWYYLVSYQWASSVSKCHEWSHQDFFLASICLWKLLDVKYFQMWTHFQSCEGIFKIQEIAFNLCDWYWWLGVSGQILGGCNYLLYGLGNLVTWDRQHHTVCVCVCICVLNVMVVAFVKTNLIMNLLATTSSSETCLHVFIKTIFLLIDWERFVIPLIYAFIGGFLYEPWLGIEPATLV